jgi:mono-ADP-ribosyltransferase sirtuin 6
MASTVDVDRLKEYEDSGAELTKKINTLVQWMRESKYTVFYTGAGVSTSSGVSDYRGPTGIQCT